MAVKINYKFNENVTVQLEVGDPKEAFETLSNYAEILTHDKCGKCKSGNIKPQVRVVDDNKFYELVCQDCGGTLAFGSHKKGNTLFPKRSETVEEGGEEVKKWLPDGGWMRWDSKLKKRV